MSGYGAHLLHGFQPHFLHPLNPAVSSANGTGPFSGGGAFVKPFPSNLPLPSAFAPPKCLGFGLDQVRPLLPRLLDSLPISDFRIFFQKDCCLEEALAAPTEVVVAVNLLGHLILLVRHVHHYPHLQKKSRWKDRRARMAIGNVIEYVHRRGVPRRPASDVSKFLQSIYTN